MTSRLVIAAVSVLGIYFGAESLKGDGMPTELAHPNSTRRDAKDFSRWTVAREQGWIDECFRHRCRDGHQPPLS